MTAQIPGNQYSKGAKKRARKLRAVAEQFALAPIQPRMADGRHKRERADKEPSIQTLQARCRHMGKEVTHENIRDMRAPWWGCYAGRLIAQEPMTEQDRLHLWDAIQHMRKVIAAYDAAIGAPRRHAACLRLLAPTDAMKADASSPATDDRTPEQIQRDATSSLMRLEGWLGYADKTAASEAKRVVWDDQIVTDGPAILSALRCVSDGLRGKRMVYRGR